jgi:uncharacterized protein (TIGR00369 family)
MTDTPQPILTTAQVDAFLQRAFPQVADDIAVVDVGPMTAEIRLVPTDRHLRPGGTISGPTLFMLADCALYLAIIAHVGEEALAVTTNASVDFLRKPAAELPLLAKAKLLKLGKSLVVGDVHLTSGDAIVARSTLTYSRPPK